MANKIFKILAEMYRTTKYETSGVPYYWVIQPLGQNLIIRAIKENLLAYEITFSGDDDVVEPPHSGAPQTPFPGLKLAPFPRFKLTLDDLWLPRGAV